MEGYGVPLLGSHARWSWTERAPREREGVGLAELWRRRFGSQEQGFKGIPWYNYNKTRTKNTTLNTTIWGLCKRWGRPRTSPVARMSRMSRSSRRRCTGPLRGFVDRSWKARGARWFLPPRGRKDGTGGMGSQKKVQLKQTILLITEVLLGMKDR